MDIHRCRFIPYPSSPINALAFSHTSPQNAKSRPPPSLRLAIGRANGDIELWNPLQGSWYQETILRGGKERSIEGLAWVQDPDENDKSGYKKPGKLRLFSTGYSHVVTEWDLAAGKPLRHSSGNGGEIWCMAAQPRDTAPPRLDSRTDEEQAVLTAKAQIQSLAVGCADGSIVMLSTDEEDLRFNRILARPPKNGTRVLSLAFQDRHRIVAGHADSTIRVYDIRGQQQFQTMTLGTGLQGGPKEILVWAVKCMNDGTIVSGDSTGTVSIWDRKTYSLNQRIKGHEADILGLAVSADGHSIFSGGIDRRTVLYRKAGPSSGKEGARWAQISHNRLHRNDVKAMAIFETNQLSVVASGGLDTIPVIIPVQEFGREHHRAVSGLPQQSCMVSAPLRRLLLSWWGRELRIWTIEERQDIPEDQDGAFDERVPRGRKLVAKIALQGDPTITSADLTANGDMVVVSTITGIKLFSLRQKGDILKVQSLPATSTFADSGAKQVQFSPDARWLVSITLGDKVQISRIDNREDASQARKLLPQKSTVLKRISRGQNVTTLLHSSLGNYDRSINRIAFSLDSKILSVSDLSGYIDTWILKGLEDLTQEDNATDNNDSSSDESSDSDEESRPQLIYGQHWIRNPATPLIPKLPTAPIVLSFRPSESKTPVTDHHTTNGNTHEPRSHNLPHGEDRLLIITADNKIREFHTLSGSLTPWSRRNPHASFPVEYRNLKDRAKGVIWDIQHDRERLWVWGVGWLWMFDLAQDLPPVDDPSSTMPPAKALTNGDHNPKPPLINDDETVLNTTSTKNKNKMKRRKRKRSQHNDQPSHDHDHDAAPPKKLPRDTGAGSRIPDHELATGISHKIKRIRGADANASTTIDISHRRGDDPSSSPDDDDEEAQDKLALKLAKLRRERNGDVGFDGGEGEDAKTEEQGEGQGETPAPPPHWHTFKYRPILGIVPLGDGGRGAEGRMEVALVERPLWDMDLPARYQGDQEWGDS